MENEQDTIITEIIEDSLLESIEQTNGEDLHSFDIIGAAQTIQTILFYGGPLWAVSRIVWRTRHPEAVKSIIKVAKDNGIPYNMAAAEMMLRRIFAHFGKDYPPYLDL